jgi:predicted ATPase
MAREIILTGAPGAGKTLIQRQLEVEANDNVEEAATDVIALQQGLGMAEPWTRPEFTETIARLQVRRMAKPAVGGVRVSDRSLVCTLALAEYLGHPISAFLERAIRESIAARQFERRVLFVELLGFITPTEARRL